MKLKYPAEAFALGIILFSAGMKEAFAAGILVILSAVFAEFLKNLLEASIPEWSLRLCVGIGTGAVCSSVFSIGFAVLGSPLETGVWILTFIIGLLCAYFSLTGDLEAEYGDLFLEASIAWGFWILLAIVREFSAGGAIFGNTVLQASFQSSAIAEPAFAFLAAGLALAFTNGVLKKSGAGGRSLLAAVPAFFLLHPFTVRIFGQAAGILISIAVPVLMFLSVKQTLKFSRMGKAYKGLPADMLAAGFIYMILNIY